jgi:3-methyladenine DNA glycosylase AlkD|tara:strand:+ start:4048 stop:4761 length:714 start_codon:yes stop_codon:yes gene_type:complete
MSASLLIAEIREALEANADEVKAPQMQRYMKSAMPYRGVQSPAVKKICTATFRKHPLDGFDSWRDTILALWREAVYREERYVALALAAAKAYRPYRTLQALAMFEEMIVTGAWWDFVDDISSRLGELLLRYPREMKTHMSDWARSGDMWKRRASIICQLNAKDRTDVQLLLNNIELNLNDEEFFIRKAIGWALRQHAKTEPETVIDFVHQHRDRMSPLSKREALRILLKDGAIAAMP